LNITLLGFLAATIIAAPLPAEAQATSYLLQFADNTVGSGTVTGNGSNVVTGISNMSLDDLTVQASGGTSCSSFCEPFNYGVTSGELNLHGTTLVLEGEIPQIGINSETTLLTVHFANPLVAQYLTGPGPNLSVEFPQAVSFTLSSTLLADLGIAGTLSNASVGGGILATGSKGSYAGFDGETNVQFTRTPEMDPASAASGVMLLLGSLAVLRGRRKSLSS